MQVKQNTTAAGWAHIWSAALVSGQPPPGGNQEPLSSLLPHPSMCLEEKGLLWGRRVVGERRKWKAHASGWLFLLLEMLIGQPE